MSRPTIAWRLYVAAFYLFLFAPLATVAVFAFNASAFPAPPWKGFTLEWFVGTGAVFGRPGVLRDPAMLASIGNSLKVALPVAALWRSPSAPRTPSCSSGRGSAARTSLP